jgi:uncharacterized Tic20 family protein
MTQPATPQEKSARNWGMLCHLAGLAGCFAPWIAHVAGPLIVWLLKRNDDAFIDTEGKESLNFQLSLALYSVVGCILLALTIVGIVIIPFFLWSLYVLNVICVIFAAIQSSGGRHFRYPLIFRFLK